MTTFASMGESLDSSTLDSQAHANGNPPVAAASSAGQLPQGVQPLGRTMLRRAQQDFVASVSYLPETLWQAMAGAPTPRRRAEILVGHMYHWGLRLPTEATLATLTSVISLFQHETGDYDLHSNLQTVRSVWKSHSKRNGTELAPEFWIAAWPDLLRNLPQRVQQLLEENPPKVPLPVSAEQIAALAKRVPLRQTHASVVHAKQEQNLISALRRIRSQEGVSVEDVGGLKNLMIFPQEKKGRPSALHNTLTEEGSDGVPSGLARPLAGRAPVAPGGILALPGPVPELRCRVCLRVGEEGEQQGGAFVCIACLEAAKEEPLQKEAVKANALEEAAAALFAKREEDKVKKRPAAAKAKAKRQDAESVEPPAPAGGAARATTGELATAPAAASAGKPPAAKATKGTAKPKEQVLAGGQPKAKGKRPAAADASADASQGKRRKKAAKEEKPDEIFTNFTFDAEGHGKCKVEFYTQKSYVRKWCVEQEKWVMLIGSTDQQWHKHICKRLVADVTRGLDRAALNEARDRYLKQMCNA